MPVTKSSVTHNSKSEMSDDNARLQRASQGQQVLSPQDLGKANRFRVLQALVDRGPLSRAELSRILGVPRASIGTITNALVESGVLQEDANAEQKKLGRGKPPKPLWFAETAGLTGAVTIESERISVGIVNARGKIIDTAFLPNRAGIGKSELLEQVSRLVEQVILPQSGNLVATGLAVPAQVNSARGEIELCTIIPALTGSPIVSHLETLTKGRVWLNQDVRALAAGERWFGRGRGSDGFAVLEIDLGVGVGIVVDGHLFPGVSVSSPQVGHTCVDRKGLLCTCDSIGCWETIASLAWLRDQANARGIAKGSSTLPIELVTLAEAGDSAATELLTEFAENLAIGIANLVQVLRTPLVVLQGAIAGAGHNFSAAVANAVSSRITWREELEIVPTALGDGALVLGAGATALSHEFGIRI